ncbi:STE/STE20/MST protein kinase [Loa loa]|uniref:Serine/threonine-protein kinase cst-1 n=1 Tax=Loa loa TaxID=7209 RepID=A0A1I7V6N0_LOALO|nr:STE/STE20/MST protein kinase [Loa loa]EFO20742.1 STE/STE20/MST protein kinase [Loa loa]
MSLYDEDHCSFEISRDRFKLDAISLNKPPEEVFDVVGKLGEGSYGSVHKAIHKQTGHVLAVKKVPVDTDLQEIIKEISIMQQCDSKYVVKYYGSYFKNSDLWIVMEYCGAGSVSDIMRIRKKTLNEAEIGAVTRDVLKGLRYLHDLKKIHRDIKAGNILLNAEGHGKLADFGVAGQLTDTMAKRNTVIGTPFWMAPEVIQEIGYDTKADIWSLGITAMEMAEGRPPHADIHPMRAIFMIPTKPPPTLKCEGDWSQDFVDFVGQCLVKNPDERKSAYDLLEHPFVVNASPSTVLLNMIDEARGIANFAAQEIQERTLESASDSTLIQERTHGDESNEMEDMTLIRHDIPSTPTNGDPYKMMPSKTITQQINSVRLPGVRPPGDTGYVHNLQQANAIAEGGKPLELPSHKMLYVNQKTEEQKHDQINPVNDGVHYGDANIMNGIGMPQTLFSTDSSHDTSYIDQHFNKAYVDGDYSFLAELPLEELMRRKANLEADMDVELRELQARYQTKRQPILDAIENKKAKITQY